MKSPQQAATITITVIGILTIAGVPPHLLIPCLIICGIIILCLAWIKKG